MASGPKSEGEAADAPSGGPAPGAGAEHQSPPVMHLEAHHIKKLFGNKMPPVGSKIKVHGLVHVGAYNEAGDGPPSGGGAKGAEGSTPRTMSLHFHKMDVAHDGISDGEKEESQRDGMKAEIDKALSRGAGSSAAKGKPAGKTPTPRGGGD